MASPKEKKRGNSPQSSLGWKYGWKGQIASGEGKDKSTSRNCYSITSAGKKEGGEKLSAQREARGGEALLTFSSQDGKKK